MRNKPYPLLLFFLFVFPNIAWAAPVYIMGNKTAGKFSSDFTFDTSEKQQAFGFTQQGNKTLDKVWVYQRAVGVSPVYRIGIQADDGSGKPNNSYLSNVTFTASGTGSYVTITLTPVALTDSQKYYVVMSVDSGSLDVSNRGTFWAYDFSGTIPLTQQADSNFHSQNKTSTATAWYGTPDQGLFVLEYQDASRYGNPCFTSAVAVHNNATSGNTTDDRMAGEAFLVTFTAQVNAVSAALYTTGAPTDNLYYRLYNLSDSVTVTSGTIAVPSIGAALTWVQAPLGADYTLESGKNYFLYFYTDGGDASNYYVCAASGSFSMHADMTYAGVASYERTTNDGGQNWNVLTSTDIGFGFYYDTPPTHTPTITPTATFTETGIATSTCTYSTTATQTATATYTPTYTPTGGVTCVALDPAFGVAGVVSGTAAGGVAEMMFSSGNKIVFGTGNEAWRIDLSGNPDTAFNGTGKAGMTSGPMAIAPDGTVYAARTGWNGTTNSYDIYFSSIRTDGTNNTFFARATYDWGIPSANDEANAMAVDQNGKIVVAGGRGDGFGSTGAFVLRFNPDGMLDTSFNGSGYVYELSYSKANAITVTAAGDIVITGRSGPYNMGVWKYKNNGTPDTTFNGTGKVTHAGDAVGGYNESYAVVEDGSGNIVVAGNAMQNITAQWNIGLWRFTSAGVPDTSFNSTGYRRVKFSSPGSFYDYGQDIALDASGRMVVAGTTQVPMESMYVARFNPDGSTDTTFNGTGFMRYSTPGLEDMGWEVLIDAGGKIYAGGSNTNTFEIIKLDFFCDGFTPTPTYTAVVTATATNTQTPSDTPTSTASHTVTFSATITATSTATATFTVTHTPTATAGAGSYCFVTQWGVNGSGNGQFQYPYGVAVDSAGFVYVADGNNNRVQKFTSSGTYVTQWGSTGNGDGQFYSPEDIAVDSAGYVYVLDGTREDIQKFTSAGSFVAKWGGSGWLDGQFVTPMGIGINQANEIFVADITRNDIQRFTSTGTFVSKWGGSGIGNGQFANPYDLGAGSAAYYVSDFNNNRVQSFNTSGVYTGQWGSAGTGAGQFSGPSGIAVDNAGSVYVVDTLNRRVQKFTSAGTFITAWGSFGPAAGQFDNPHGIAVDSSWNVYVADSQNNRIQKFAPCSTFTPTNTPTVTPTITPVYAGFEEGDSYTSPEPSIIFVYFNYKLDKDAEKIRIDVYNFAGVHTAYVEEKTVQAGLHRIQLNLEKFAPGVYYYVIKAHFVGGEIRKFKPAKFLVVK